MYEADKLVTVVVTRTGDTSVRGSVSKYYIVNIIISNYLFYYESMLTSG